jgi:phage virion morphogenesis protein
VATVALKLTFDDVAKQHLLALPEQFSNTDVLLDNIGQYLHADAMQRFRREETPDGDQWAQSERAESDGGLTLTDYGNLANSITHNVSGGVLEHGSDEIYAAIHQFGGKTGRGEATELVARPYIGIGAEQQRQIGFIVENWGSDVIN